MRFTLTTRQLQLPTDFVQMVQHRLTHALGRLDGLVRTVDLRLEDVNGPKGGVDVRCLAVVHLAQGGELVVRGTDTDAGSAVGQVLDRVRQSLRRTHGRMVHALHGR